MYKAQKRDLRKTVSKIGMSFIFTIILEILLTYSRRFVDNQFILGNTKILEMVIRFISFLVPYSILIKIKGYKIKNTIQLQKPKKHLFSYVVIGVAFSIIAGWITDLLINALQIFNVRSETPPELFQYENTPIGIFLYLLSLTVVPAIAEEFVFRGAALGLLRKFGATFAIITSSLMFGLMHGNFEQIIYAFLLGLYSGFITVKTKSIFPAVLVHFFCNLINAFFFLLYGTESTENAAIVVYGFILVVAIICAINVCIDDRAFMFRLNDTSPKCNLSAKDKIFGFIFNSGMILFLIYVGRCLYVSVKV